MNIVCLDGVTRNWRDFKYAIFPEACSIGQIPNGRYFDYAEGLKSPFFMIHNPGPGRQTREYRCTITGSELVSSSAPWSQIYLLSNYGPRNLNGT